MSRQIAIELGTLGDGILRALLEDDPEKRHEAMMAWKDSVLGVIQAALPDALSAYAQTSLDDWGKVNDAYRREALTNDLAQRRSYSFVTYLRTEARNPAPPSGVAAAVPVAGQVEGGNSESYSEPSRSPNDNRSDSMNPNNPAYQAAMDNRSNQMNPNNPAYHSSHGGGRR